MNSLEVCTQTNKYPIYFENSFDNLLDAFNKANITNRKVCIIADSNTSQYYGNELLGILKSAYQEVYLFEFEAGEKSKNLSTIQDMYNFFLEKHLDRKSIIVALGGGVVGDMAGFAAATYMRGIDFVQIPTTILSQVDSSVGGKVGVDFNGIKNIVGAFYQPLFVYINVNTAKTLPKREFSAGMAETIKYGMILDKTFYDYIKANKSKIVNMDTDILKSMIRRSCEFKADVVSKDEKESGLREILNFGHTIGHAVESLLGFELVHGECVALGMISAAYISMKKGNIGVSEFEDLKAIIEYFNLPVNIKPMDTNEIYNQMFLDKKVSNNTLSFVLLNKIGEFVRTKAVSKDEIFEAINIIIEK